MQNDTTILLKNDDLTVEISPLGAEIQRIVDKNGVDRLWNGDPQFWTGRAPVLFPIAGGMKDGGFIYDGQKYPMKKHGFARRLLFQIERAGECTATFLLNEKVPDYPFDYELRLRYTLEGNRIRVEYITDNAGTGDMYYSIGCHEAYMAPGGIEHYQVVFDEDDELLNNPCTETGVSKETQLFRLENRTLSLKEDFFKIDALCFLSLKSRGVTLQNDLNGQKVRVEFADFPYLLIWKKVGAPFVAIEPWHNSVEFDDASRQLTEKSGQILLRPGESRTLTHTIAFL